VIAADPDRPITGSDPRAAHLDRHAGLRRRFLAFPAEQTQHLI